VDEGVGCEEAAGLLNRLQEKKPVCGEWFCISDRKQDNNLFHDPEIVRECQARRFSRGRRDVVSNREQLSPRQQFPCCRTMLVCAGLIRARNVWWTAGGVGGESQTPRLPGFDCTGTTTKGTINISITRVLVNGQTVRSVSYPK
jgi:hypothetical protein